MPELSVILPTRNRAGFLGRALQSLCEQSVDPSRYEICVVDNGSTDQTAQVIPLVRGHYPHHQIQLVREEIVGLSQARNCGFRHTTSPLIAGADDDATMPPDWIEKFLEGFAKGPPELAKIGGDIIPVWMDKRPEWLIDSMLPLITASSGLGDKPRFVDQGMLEGNSCCRRDALTQAGGFPTELGRKGGHLLSAENAIDLVMVMRGWKLFYDPSIIIHHTIHADRLKPVWMRRRYFWQGVSDYAVYMYLKTKGIEAAHGLQVEMPFDRANWTFINNAEEPPNLDNLNRLRSLGFVLATSGFIPV